MEAESLRRRYEEIQNALSKKLRFEDELQIEEIRSIAGVDLAYWKESGKEFAVCCIVVIDVETHDVIEIERASGEIEVPYMPGFLAFRELPLIERCASRLANIPDVYMLDGNGCLHPRRMGEASQASFTLDRPTIGVAKTYYKVDGVDFTRPPNEAGSFTDIVIGGEIRGRALRTHDGVRPVFVSAGNRITLDTATKLTLMLTDKESRIPIPTRLADLETHTAREKLCGEAGEKIQEE